MSLTLLILSAILILYIIHKKVKKPLTHKDVILLKRKINNMSPDKFEYFCAYMFVLLGYNAHVTSSTRDGGKDVIVNNSMYIECKHWKAKVGRPVAMKLYGAMSADGIKKGYIMTSSSFTKDCLIFCKRTNIICYDLNDILNICKKVGRRIMYC